MMDEAQEEFEGGLVPTSSTARAPRLDEVDGDPSDDEEVDGDDG